MYDKANNGRLADRSFAFYPRYPARSTTIIIELIKLYPTILAIFRLVGKYSMSLLTRHAEVIHCGEHCYSFSHKEGEKLCH